MHFFSGVKSFWSVQSNQLIIDTIKKRNRRNKTMLTATYDFSTLRTNIPHNKLKDLMKELINFYFKGGKNSLLLYQSLVQRGLTIKINLRQLLIKIP